MSDLPWGPYPSPRYIPADSIDSGPTCENCHKMATLKGEHPGCSHCGGMECSDFREAYYVCPECKYLYADGSLNPIEP